MAAGHGGVASWEVEPGPGREGPLASLKGRELRWRLPCPPGSLQALLRGCPAPPLWGSERPQSTELDGGRHFGARIHIMRLFMRVSEAQADGCVGKSTGSGIPFPALF